MKSEHWRCLERMYVGNPTNAWHGASLQIEEGRTELRAPVRPEHCHAAGAMHGSLYFKALDDAAYFAVNSLVEDVFVLTTSFQVYLLRPVSAGEVRAVGRVVNSSRRLYVAEAEVFDAEGRLLGRGSGTFMPSERKLADVPGYA